ncbi:MAG: hypothetical protein IJ988_00090, partial [Firmicutes bacterium]|nr:hypothetical protein [Bacillota bacterium]
FSCSARLMYSVISAIFCSRFSLNFRPQPELRQGISRSSSLSFLMVRLSCAGVKGLAVTAPTCPYTVNKKGHGPAWANSLFEDNAEFGYGMQLAYKARRATLAEKVAKLAEVWECEEGKAACKAWIEGMDDAEASKAAAAALIKCLENCNCGANELCKEIYAEKDCLVKKSFWIIGGDGWAYDIGYGGLDHVLASGENVNVLVFDTEVYSNTGGQASKSTPVGAVAQFAAGGKAVRKKDLAQIAMAYGYVYVAQIAMGANPAQTLKAIKEAEAYDGPSLIIAYAPCINHGVKAGMNKAMLEMKNAVRSGYWNLLRYNPDLIAQKRNPLSVDSAPPTESYNDFIMGEVRYNSLKLKNPERADELFKQAEEIATDRYKKLKRQQKSFDEQ